MVEEDDELPNAENLPLEVLGAVLDCLDTMSVLIVKSVCTAWLRAGRHILPRRWPGLRPGCAFTFDALPHGESLDCQGGRVHLHADGSVTGIYLAASPATRRATAPTARGHRSGRCRRLVGAAPGAPRCLPWLGPEMGPLSPWH